MTRDKRNKREPSKVNIILGFAIHIHKVRRPPEEFEINFKWFTELTRATRNVDRPLELIIRLP